MDRTSERQIQVSIPAGTIQEAMEHELFPKIPLINGDKAEIKKFKEQIDTAISKSMKAYKVAKDLDMKEAEMESKLQIAQCKRLRQMMKSLAMQEECANVALTQAEKKLKEKVAQIEAMQQEKAELELSVLRATTVVEEIKDRRLTEGSKADQASDQDLKKEITKGRGEREDREGKNQIPSQPVLV